MCLGLQYIVMLPLCIQHLEEMCCNSKCCHVIWNAAPPPPPLQTSQIAIGAQVKEVNCIHRGHASDTLLSNQFKVVLKHLRYWKQISVMNVE